LKFLHFGFHASIVSLTVYLTKDNVMLPRSVCWAAGVFLWTAAAHGQGAGGPASSTPNTLEIRNCTVLYVNRSTYATARPGIIAELPFDEGDRVQAGDLVIRLRDEVAVANLELRTFQSQMETPILVAKKELEAADISHRAATIAVSTVASAFPQTEIDRLRIVAEARQLQVKEAEEELHLNELARNEAAAELATYRVHAEFGGVVTRVHKHVGEAVNLGDGIITIVDPSRVRVEGTVPYVYARRLRVGDPVSVQLNLSQDRDLSLDSLSRAGNDESARELISEEKEVFEGRIGFIDVQTPDAIGLSDMIRVWAEVENRDNILLEGLPAVMRVQLLH
jgi:multidrug efflux pump subunit AcrA (membrane-fusion protein)